MYALQLIKQTRSPTRTIFEELLTQDINDVIVTVGPRTEKEITYYDRAIVDGISYPSRECPLPWYVKKVDESGEEVVEVVDKTFFQEKYPILKDKCIEISGGIANPLTFMQVFRVEGNGIKLKDVEKNFKTAGVKNGIEEVPPLAFAYWDSFERCVKDDPEFFEEIYKIPVENFKDLSMALLRNIGNEKKVYGTEKSLPYPQWNLVARMENGEIGKDGTIEGYGEEQVIWTPRVPFTGGTSAAVGYFLPSIFNRKKPTIQVTGAKGGDTTAMNAVITNQERFLFDTGNKDHPTVYVYVDGVEELHDLIYEAVSEVQKKAYEKSKIVDAFAIGIQTYLRKKEFEDSGITIYGLPEEVKTIRKSFPSIDFWARIDKKWKNGDELKDEGYL